MSAAAVSEATDRGCTSARRRSVQFAAGLAAALVTAPGRPPDRPVPQLSFRRFWRTVAAAQVFLAVAVLVFYVVHRPWPEPLWVSLLLGTLPLTVVRLGRPLDAWRCSIVVTLLVALEVLLWTPDTAVLYVSLLPAVLVYLVGLGYRRVVLFAVWSVTVVVAPVVLMLFGQVSVRHWPYSNGFVLNNYPGFAVASVLLATTAAVLAHNVRARRVITQALNAEALRSAEQQTSQALWEERSRIARELHDVVAHHMSVVAIHAETAPYRVAAPPPELADSFAVIRASAVEALAEMRRLLVLLRSPDDAAETAPQPRLDQVDELVATARTSGHAAEVRILGTARALPPGLDLSGYRIVQEGVSNVLRHAPGARFWVEVSYLPDALHLTVYNSKPDETKAMKAESRHATGHGLLGMRERTAMLGGSLTAEATPEGGFLLKAQLPVPAPAPVSGGATGPTAGDE